MKQLTTVSLLVLATATTGCLDDGAADEQAHAEAATLALYDVAPVLDPACHVVRADGTGWTESRQLAVTLHAQTTPGALQATVTSMGDPTLSLVMTFDGVWNTFEGSARSASGTWLDVRGRMTGNALTVSYAERGVAGPNGVVPSVFCQDLVGTATFALPTPVKLPPPSWCEAPDATTTGIHATLRVDTYEGTRPGFNLHEFARATIIKLPWIYDARLLDTMHVELAMRVDATGLPHEIPLTVGQLVEVEGEYIPGAVADAPDPSGRLDAVIHYTHAECGYAIIAGTRYN